MKKILFILQGFSSIFCLFEQPLSPSININKNFFKDDTKALESDWKIVGKDIYKGIEEFSNES